VAFLLSPTAVIDLFSVSVSQSEESATSSEKHQRPFCEFEFADLLVYLQVQAVF
jgi:hypothetical protein